MKYFWHILFWVIYCLFEAYINAKMMDGFSSISLDSFLSSLWITLITLPPRLIFAYVLLRNVIPEYFADKKNIFQGIIYFISLFVAMLILYRVLINFVAWPLVFNHFPGFDILDMGLTSLSTTRTLAPVALLVGACLIVERQENQLNVERLKQAKLESELQLLKAQVQPHFLFNTLNNIYVLAHNKSEHTAPAVAGLSKLMRFVLYESGKEKTTIASESHIIDEYIKLEKLRYGSNLKVVFNRNIENPSQMISPLLLLPMVENAFKHGASESTEDAYIQCAISEKNGNFDFMIKNSVHEHESKQSTGIGLKNLKRQLQISYPGKHELHIFNEAKYFLAKLKLELL